MLALSKKADLSHSLCIALYSGLLITLLAKTWWLDPPQGSQWINTLIQIVPLLLPVAGLLRKQPRSAAWLCFILCFYFINGVLATWINPSEIHEWVITFLCSSLFITAMLFTRWQGKRLYKGESS